MTKADVDIAIVGAGPVGLMCAYLARICGLNVSIIDKSDGPLKVGRADALNARTLQLLELVGLFDELYPLGKKCNTSSVWANGNYISRQSSWWDELEGCLHKHFLMLGQSYVESLLDKKLNDLGASVLRSTTVEKIEVSEVGCVTFLSNGDQIKSKFVIGADGPRSFVREQFKIPFQIIRPQITWAVIDGIIETNFYKVPEIIVFQAETSDVAWIPREGGIDRFYVRMDRKEFSLDEVIQKINNAMKPHVLSFKEITWYSQFSVKESVAEKFFIHERIFLAGDSSHIHSVNGGQGLNTGLADAFNLIWKLNFNIKFRAPKSLLNSYEEERKPVALSVIESSGELVRATKYSENGTHAQDYVKIVEKRSGNITGMGIRYGEKGLAGTRLFDFEIYKNETKLRIYTILNYAKFTILIFGQLKIKLNLPNYVQVFYIKPEACKENFWTNSSAYKNQVILVRPDSYIESMFSIDEAESILSDKFW